MNIRLISIIIITSIIFSGTVYGAEEYGIPHPDLINNPEFVWEILDSPNTPFDLFWTGTTAWYAETSSTMTFKVNQIAQDVQGRFTLGNISVVANDTDIAKEFVLGVWGLTSFLPGLIIEVDETSLSELNTTAYASAERVAGNYLNGTMTSSYETLVINGQTYECITFSYIQDETSFGTPQETKLSYDLDTGVIVYAKTSYSFGIPFVLEFEIRSITTANVMLILGISTGAVILLIGIVTIFRRK
ncbi:MAG: conserved exported protein of unknown function [Candidatus Thorarchaeota archaeon]|nr:MAG: conserved exported protein of unknown function [Candidatus Thorarchaeota archaeon]